ncbi:MAG: hypothetical protein RIQ54_14 [Candidatus Parcubacteria bacterium]
MRISLAQALTAAIAITTTWSYAATPIQAAESAVCQLESPNQIQKNLNDNRQNLKDDLRIRKELLKNIIDCARTQNEMLKKEVEDLAVTDPEIKQIQKNITTDLQRNNEFYRLQKEKVEGLGLYGTKELARTLKQWREANYVATSKIANNLILWHQNQSLFSAAQKRFELIEQTVRALNSINNQDIQDVFSETQELFEQAQKENSQARAKLIQSTDPDETVDIMRKSLKVLAQTYRKFLDVGDAIKTVIPQ